MTARVCLSGVSFAHSLLIRQGFAIPTHPTRQRFSARIYIGLSLAALRRSMDGAVRPEKDVVVRMKKTIATMAGAVFAALLSAVRTKRSRRTKVRQMARNRVTDDRRSKEEL